MNASEQLKLGACPVEFERMRSALEHIVKTARASRSMTRRTRWIEQRAQRALDGLPFETNADIELPKHATEASHERLKKQSYAIRRHNGTIIAAVQELLTQLDVVQLSSQSSALMAAVHEAVLNASWIAGIQPDEGAEYPSCTALNNDQRRDLTTALGRALGTWECPPAWLVTWHDPLVHVPAPAERPVALEGGA